MTLPTTPSLSAARAELAALITTAAAASAGVLGYNVLVADDNRAQIDLGSPEAEKAHLEWQILWRSGQQASLGANPLAVQWGQLVLAAKVKEGSGTDSVLKVLDHFIPYLEMRDCAITRSLPADVKDARVVRGWYSQPAIINFWLHRIVTSSP